MDHGLSTNYEILSNLLHAGMPRSTFPIEISKFNYQELISALTTVVNPSVVLTAWLQQEKLFALPEFLALKGIPQNPKHHPEGDVFTHTLMALDEATRIVRRNPERYDSYSMEILLLGVLCHDLGKATKTHLENGESRSPKHEEAGELPTRSLLGRLQVPRDITEAVVAIVRNHARPVGFFRLLQNMEVTDCAYGKIVQKVVQGLEGCPVEVFWMLANQITEGEEHRLLRHHTCLGNQHSSRVT